MTRESSVDALLDPADAMEEKVRRLEAERLRLWDLVRHQRMALHEKDLISDDEYAALLRDGKSVSRLHTYDDLRARITMLEEALREIMDKFVDPTHKAVNANCMCQFCKVVTLGRAALAEGKS